MKRLFYTIAAALVATACMSNTSCGGGSYEESDGIATDNAMMLYDGAVPEPAAARGEILSPVATGTETPAAVNDPKKIIKTGRMSMDVGDLARAKAGVDGLSAAMGCYYSSEEFDESDYSTTYTLSIRIPSAGYERFIDTLESAGYGSVSNKTIDARDVTEEFIDIETRLENKRNYLERYRQLLKRAATIKDIMEIEEQIRVLEEEIESAEGRLRYLGDQVSYSTLDLTLTQRKDYKYTPPAGDNFFERVKRALSGGWNILKFIILVIIRLWPVWIIAGGVFFVVRYIRRKRRNHKK